MSVRVEVGSRGTFTAGAVCGTLEYGSENVICFVCIYFSDFYQTMIGTNYVQPFPSPIFSLLLENMKIAHKTNLTRYLASLRRQIAQSVEHSIHVIYLNGICECQSIQRRFICYALYCPTEAQATPKGD